MPCAHRFRRLDLDFIAMTLLVKKVKDSFWDPSHGCRRLIGIAQEWPTSEQSARNSGENIIAFHRLQTARKRKKLSTGSRARTLSRSSSRRSPHNLSSMVWPPKSYHHQLVLSGLGLISFPWPPFPSKRTTKGHQMPRVQRLEPQTQRERGRGRERDTLNALNQDYNALNQCVQGLRGEDDRKSEKNNGTKTP